MNKALSFAKLDMYTIKPYSKMLLLFLGLSVAMLVVFKSASTMCFYLMMCLMLVDSYPFTIGEKNGMDTLYATLSLKRRDVVMGRYLFVLGMQVACILLILVMAGVSQVMGILDVSLPELLLYLCAASLTFSVLLSVQYPFYFKLGYSKAKWVNIAPFALVMLGVLLISNVPKTGTAIINVDGLLNTLMARPVFLCVATVVAELLVLGLSCAISCRLYEKKDL